MKHRVLERKRKRFSGKTKEPKPKLFGPDILGWGGGLPREGVGAEKFGMSLETRETKLSWRDIPGFWRDITAVPEKFENQILAPEVVSFQAGQIGGNESRGNSNLDLMRTYDTHDYGLHAVVLVMSCGKSNPRRCPKSLRKKSLC